MCYKDTRDEIISAFMRREGLTLKKLAGSLGITVGHAWRIKAGRRAPGKKTALKLAKLTGNPLTDFIRED